MRKVSAIFLAALCVFFAPDTRAQQPATAQEAAAYNADGVEAYNSKLWAEAVASFEKSLQLQPDNAVIARNLCNAYQSLANDLVKRDAVEQAVQRLESAIVVDPRNPSPLIQLASYYFHPRINAIQDAVYRLQEALELDPKNVDAHDLLGDAFYKTNNLSAAREAWEWVQKTQPDRPGLADKLKKVQREEAVESDFRDSGSRHFNLSYTPGTPSRELAKVQNILEKAFIQVGLRLGRTYPPTPVQVIIYNAQGFTDATQLGGHVGALYDGKIRIPLMDEQGAPLKDDELTRRLYHEYSHVVIRFICGDKVPWWLNEGLAEYLSRDFDAHRKEQFAQACAEEKLNTLTALEQGQLEKLGVEALAVAYVQAHATVNFLWERFGQVRILQLLKELKGSELPPEQVLRRVAARNYNTLEREVAHAYCAK